MECKYDRKQSLAHIAVGLLCQALLRSAQSDPHRSGALEFWGGQERWAVREALVGQSLPLGFKAWGSRGKPINFQCLERRLKSFGLAWLGWPSWLGWLGKLGWPVGLDGLKYGCNTVESYLQPS